MSGSKLLVRGIRDHLCARGMTYRDLAIALGISEPTVKRDLARGNFSLARLDHICQALGVSIDGLLHNNANTILLNTLSDQQELELVADPHLLLVTYLVLNDWKFSEIVSAFRFDDSALVSLLLRLDAMKLIEYRPPHRMRKLSARNFAWRKDGPVHAFFIQRIVPEFFASRFDDPADGFHFMAGTLSEGSRRYMTAELTRLAGEFDRLARQDARLPLDARDGCSALLALRRWEFSEFTQLRRETVAIPNP